MADVSTTLAAQRQALHARLDRRGSAGAQEELSSAAPGDRREDRAAPREAHPSPETSADCSGHLAAHAFTQLHARLDAMQQTPHQDRDQGMEY